MCDVTPNYIDFWDEAKGGHIYLRYLNVVDGKLLDRQYEGHNIIEYQDKFMEKSMIYNNGGSEIWR